MFAKFRAAMARAGLADLIVSNGDNLTASPMESGGSLSNVAIVLDGWDYGIAIVNDELVMIGGDDDVTIMSGDDLSSEFLEAIS